MTRLRASLLAVGVLLLSSGSSRAHVGALRGAEATSGSIPFWLVLLTGGAIVAASFLMTSLITDHETIRGLVETKLSLPRSLGESLRPVGSILGILGLVVVFVVGVAGPQRPTRNLAILLVWGLWWGGFPIWVYAVGNSWPAVDPWRTITRWARFDQQASLPDSIGSWPAVVALLGLVWLEVVSPVGEDPWLLVGVVALYGAVTVAGGLRYGEVWFERIDPVAGVFRIYGSQAPIQRDKDGTLEVRFPGAGLVPSPPVNALSLDRVAFVIALLWVTTYDGLVSTPLWAQLLRPVVNTGIPALAVYILVLLVGFGLFLFVYLLAARLARRSADTFVSSSFMAGYFAMALVPIAAGYHLAHFLGYFLSIVPAVVSVAMNPLSPGVPLFLSIPGWFGYFSVAFVLGGHLLAVWVAHTLAFEVFPGRLQPIRSQYPFIIVMIVYTMISLWVVTQPTQSPPMVIQNV